MAGYNHRKGITNSQSEENEESLKSVSIKEIETRRYKMKGNRHAKTLCLY